jgi:hypothetical protein
MSKKRSRLASALWAQPAIPKLDWKELERAIGRDFDDGQRAQIFNAANEFLATEGKERAAPFVDDEAEWLARLLKLAVQLRETLEFLPARDQASRHAFAGVQVAFSDLAAKAGAPASDLATVATWLPSAVQVVQKRRAEQAAGGLTGFVEGEAWAVFIQQIRALFTDWGISIGARNDGERDSPFVSFLFLLQNAFPHASQRHGHGRSALAKAISRTRRSSAPVNRTRTAAEWLADYNRKREDTGHE